MQTEQIIEQLKQKKLTVATAESCTGGLLAAAITEVAGASEVFGCGLVTYSNQAKAELLSVSGDTLAAFGAVSEQTAGEMVRGLLRVSGADIALATTGIAGPGGGSAEKPVGTVYIGCGSREHLQVERNLFAGSRAEVRRQTVERALELLQAYLEDDLEDK